MTIIVTIELLGIRTRVCCVQQSRLTSRLTRSAIIRPRYKLLYLHFLNTAPTDAYSKKNHRFKHYSAQTVTL